MDLGLKGKVAIVSGASSGMGRAIAGELAKEGARVALAARGAERLTAVRREIQAAGGAAVETVADMTTVDGVKGAHDACIRAFGPPDIAIANVRPLNRFGFDESSDDDFRVIYEQLVLSVVHLVREVAPAMKQRKWGRIVIIGSVCGKEPHRFYNLILSNTGRAAALGLNRSLSNELAAFGITVNTVLPGVIDTGVLQQVETSGGKRVEDVPRIPLGRTGKPEEIAAMCSFLCSERAGYVTGQAIAVDGGYTRGLY